MRTLVKDIIYVYLDFMNSAVDMEGATGTG